MRCTVFPRTLFAVSMYRVSFPFNKCTIHYFCLQLAFICKVEDLNVIAQYFVETHTYIYIYIMNKIHVFFHFVCHIERETLTASNTMSNGIFQEICSRWV